MPWSSVSEQDVSVPLTTQGAWIPKPTEPYRAQDSGHKAHPTGRMRSQDRPCSPATLGRRTRDGQPGPAPRADSEPHWPPVPAHACRGHTPHRRSEASWFLLFTRQFTDVGGNSKVHTAATEKCKKNLCHQNRKRNGISFLSEVSARVRMPPLDEELDTEGVWPTRDTPVIKECPGCASAAGRGGCWGHAPVALAAFRPRAHREEPKAALAPCPAEKAHAGRGAGPLSLPASHALPSCQWALCHTRPAPAPRPPRGIRLCPADGDAGGEFPRPCTPLTRLPEGHLQSPWAPRPQQVLPGAQLPQGQQEGLGRGVQSPEEDMWAHRNLIWSLHGARHPAFYPLGCGARPGHSGPEGSSCPRLPGGSGDGEERLAAYAQHP